MTVFRLGLFIISALLGVVCTSASAQVRPPAADPAYYEFGSATIAPPFVNNFINFPTPPGRRYVIEQASVTCTTSSNTDVFTQALLNVTKITGPAATVPFSSPVVVLEKRGPSFLGGYLWSGTAHVTLITDTNPFIADGSGALFFNIFHTDITATANCFATLFGHSVLPGTI